MNLLMLCLMAFQAPATGAAPAFSSDRPDQTDAPNTVGTGYYQLEMGYQRTEFDFIGGDVAIQQIPTALLRIGLQENLELRLSYDGYIDIDVPRGDGESGSGDGYVGLKWRFHNSDNAQWALMVNSNLTLGDDDLVTDEWQPSAKLAFGTAITEIVSLGANAGIATQDQDGDLETIGIYSLVFGFGLTERVGFFAEAFGEVPASAEGRPRNSADIGLTYAISDHFQCDLAYTRGISDAAPDWSATTGFTYRF